jgi:ABC-type lipopolysaccharide export system ATPase subunit
MFEGRILMTGNAQTLADSAQARELYLGEKFSL